MNRQEAFIYNENYSYFKSSLERSGQTMHNLRLAARDYLHIWLPLGLKPGDKLLDVGCNIGTLGHMFKHTGVNTIGVDLNLAAILTGKQRYGVERKNLSLSKNFSLGTNFSLVGDGRSLPFTQHTFDAVVSQDVLEHLPDEQDAKQMLDEMAQMLKPGKDKMFHKITVREEKDNMDADKSHFIKWPAARWVDFFEANGWQVLGPTIRHFPLRKNNSYGNFLIQRAA